MEKPAPEAVYTVSQLNRAARQLLEAGLPGLWLTGEISNFSRPASGHIYLTLKDETAQVRCAFFRGAQRGLRFNPENGQQVLARARVGLYEPRGEFQLIIEHLEPAGDGLLLRRLEELKAKLAAEGLFDAARKRPLPVLPTSVGVITSRTGAALRDILQILRRRFPATRVVLYPVAVQGEKAKHEIVAALATAGARGECDVLIVGRGGGSLEDLWAFNEEIVARAIRACPIPVVSAVGHETDFTLADFAADVRAPTPSGAAELAVPDWREWLGRFVRIERDCDAALRDHIAQLATRRRTLESRLARTHPGFVLDQHRQRSDELATRMTQATRRLLALRRLQARHALQRLQAATPRLALQRCMARLASGRLRLRVLGREFGSRDRQRLAEAAAALQAYSPLRTLERGYAIVTAVDGSIVRSARDLETGQQVRTRLGVGEFDAVVSAVHGGDRTAG
jgi:exodeoxyribonuclease VII large subunit